MRLLAALFELLLEKLNIGTAERADVYMPGRALAISLALVLFSILYGISIRGEETFGMVLSAIAFVAGICVFLSWKNFAIHVLSDEQFSHTNMFGKTTVYAFSDITGMTQRGDIILYVAGKKVRIDPMAAASERWKLLLRDALDALV